MLKPPDSPYALSDPEAWRHEEAPLYAPRIVVTPAGVFVVKREDWITSCRPARLADFARLYPGAQKQYRLGWGGFQLPARVPWSMLAQAVSFFRIVWQKKKREDVLLLYYDTVEKQYILEHPPVLSADQHHVQYDVPATSSTRIRMGSLHSHGQEHAYHSYQDKQDDLASPGVHITIGDVEACLPTIACYGSDGDACFQVSPADIFEFPEAVSVPKEWLADVSADRSAHPRLKGERL